MFKKLRNKFLVLNMVVISIMMIFSFAVIFFISYNNIQTVNKEKINSVEVIRGGGKRPNSTLSFSIVVNGNGEVSYIDSLFDLPIEFYQEAAELAWSGKQDYSIINVNDTSLMYIFRSKDEGAKTVTSEGIAKNTHGSNLIIFMDVTDTMRTLSTLSTTFLLIGTVMLAVIAAISYFFANRAIKPIKQAWEKQEQFIADASHELKTPLTVINSNYDVLIANREETIDSQIKWMERIKSGVDRMAAMVNGLLSLAAMGNTDMHFTPEIIDIGYMVRETLKTMEVLMKAKGILLETDIQALTVKTEAELVSQIISILIDNAIKYTNEGGEITVALHKERHQAVFTVKNTGKGITADELPKLFDRFYRGDKSRRSSNGFGLGLSIAKTAAEKLGGHLTVESVENENTTFTLILRA